MLAADAEVIIFAPHIQAFRNNQSMDEAVREIGYHGSRFAGAPNVGQRAQQALIAGFA